MKVTLTDEQWQKILPFLKTCLNIYVGRENECRRFLEGVLWIARSGAQWRLLPDVYGNWNTVYKRFARWSQQNVFEKLFEFCAADKDLEHLLIDSTIIRAHASAAGAQKNTAHKP
jgi:transposase